MVRSKPASFLEESRPVLRLRLRQRPGSGLPRPEPGAIWSVLIRTTILLCCVLYGVGCGRSSGNEVVLYCGRSASLAGPLIERFEKATGVDVKVKYGSSAQLALALGEEGSRTAADMFWAQEAGALGALEDAGMLALLPEGIVAAVPARFRAASGSWVGTSGRARTLAYVPDRVADGPLPASVFDLTDPRWRGRVAWAPANASFQAFVTALRQLEGDDRAEAWLRAMKDNGAKSYPSNTAIVEALAAGEADLGLPNHYYLLRFKSDDPDFPVDQTFFRSGDPGNLVNVAGVAVLRTAEHPEVAQQFVRYLLSAEVQRHFIEETHEYPVTDVVSESAGELLPLPRLVELAPQVDLDSLGDLEQTLVLLRKVGLL